MREASPRGTYLLVADSLRSDITQGGLTDVLPSESSLGAKYDVSRNTVRRALKVLEAEGLLESAPGIGWRLATGGDRRDLLTKMTDLISDMGLVVGDRYPSEAELCERFKASRTAVRRALGHMEGEGLLDTVHGKGRSIRVLPASPAQP